MTVLPLKKLGMVRSLWDTITRSSDTLLAVNLSTYNIQRLYSFILYKYSFIYVAFALIIFTFISCSTNLLIPAYTVRTLHG